MENSRAGILVTNIQRFSLHDGPGIRTTVFLKGCILRCPWCSNPENLLASPQNYIKNGLRKTYGMYMGCEELYKEVKKDYLFYEPNIGKAYENRDYGIKTYEEWSRLPGGVTFSGGEALIQIDQLEPLLQRLKEEKIHMAVETSLFVDMQKVEKAIDYFDLFYVDMKILDRDRCKMILGGDIDLYESNWQKLIGAQKPVVVRIPIIQGFTDDEGNRKLILKKLKKIARNMLKVELIKGHQLGNSKYESLGYEVPEFGEISDELLEDFKESIQSMGIKAEICKI